MKNKICTQLFDHIAERYGINPDYPFGAETPIFRHVRNRKWFAAVILNLPRTRLGQGDGLCDIINLKCHPMLSGSYRMTPGILPGYHMNKEHWITVVLDGTVPTDMVHELLDLSFNMTVSSKK